MDTRRLIGLLFVFCSPLAIANPLNNQSDEQLFKNFALSSCIAEYYKGSEAAKDALTAMQGYREFSNLPLDLFFDVYELLKNNNMSDYRAKDGRTIKLAYCIDFSNSERLLSLYNAAQEPEL
ncbi:hypothetical protein BOO30_18840 [Vibrio navarrensis]|uniref:T6SS amidase immunity protein Tai4 family protein n=1 Tax=Vibrio navarrensis TaxID=29495 RepID=UPI001869D553|nr:T6SS amidase immunity protein Tai4 family protein [Vibrio navarrensis]MBE4579633.1 hypothetical protein [Vibrio navarrensis]MBE4598415.1 hypothetical protein [Vibrio navarrensis]